MRIPLIPPLDSEGIRHPVPIQVAMVFRLIPPPLAGAKRRWFLALSHRLFSGQAGIFFPQRVSFHGQIDFVGVMDEPVEDGIGDGGITHPPFGQVRLGRSFVLFYRKRCQVFSSWS